jgi:S1/P1 Nuclease
MQLGRSVTVAKLLTLSWKSKGGLTGPHEGMALAWATMPLTSGASQRVFVVMKIIFAALLGQILLSRMAFAWFAEGHEIVAIIAADNLTPTARSHVAQMLSVPDDTGEVEKAMAAASIRPDTEFREQDRTTAPWHYIDICLQDKQTDLPARCPQGNCVTAKIDEYAQRLRGGNYDKWGAAGDLAFLIHFVGDIHQPLHTTTNADRGGNCQQVNIVPAEENLHYSWDDVVVVVLEHQFGTSTPDATARKLEALYPTAGDPVTWKPGESDQIA